jgi:hypothetical protein
MPRSSDGETGKDANGTGETSVGACSRAEYVCGGNCRVARRTGPRVARPRRRDGALERDVGEAKLACAEGDDAADGVVRRDANGDPVARHDFDPEPTHAPAELREHLVARVALHAVEATAVHRNDGALNINQVVLTQSKSFRRYASIVPHG